MSLFAELKRRNVFRVGIAYLVVAWLVMQVADVVINNVGAPGWVFQIIMLVLGTGFPLVLIFAWAFELTPDGVKRDSEVDRSESIRQETGQKLNRGIILILVVALSYFVWESRFHNDNDVVAVSETETSVKIETQALADQAAEQSVAVLPFINMSSDPEQEYFSDGITEEIINALVKIPGLSVPARTSVFGFKGQQGDVRNIGQQLGVTHVLEGSIRSQGKQVRITAQLIKVDDGFHLWSETYDRQLDNIFIVQEEIAAAIARVLTGELGLEVITVPNQTNNMEAYDSYLQGRALLHKRGEENLDQAIELFTHTVTLDPEFAPGWAAMALTYSVMDWTSARPEKAISTANHALSLDPDNVDALDALASALRESWQWADAEVYFEQAMAIDPQSSELLEDYAEFLGMVGRIDDYLSIGETGYAVDPLLGPLADSYVLALSNMGKYDRAMEVIEEWNKSTNQEHIPDWWHEPVWKMMPLMAGGDTSGAIAMAKKIGPEQMSEPVKLAIIELLEDPANEQARDILRNTVSTENRLYYSSDSYTSYLVLIYTGDIDYSIDRMISDARQYGHGNIEHIWSPILSELRQLPRFEEFLELVNLPEYWDQAGWPNICQRHDDGRIACQ